MTLASFSHQTSVFIRHTLQVKMMYLGGSSVKKNRVIGGFTEKELVEKFRRRLAEKKPGDRTLDQQAQMYARHFINQIESADLTLNMKAGSIARLAGTPELRIFADPNTISNEPDREARKKLESHMRDDTYGAHGQKAPVPGEKPNDLAHPVYLAVNVLDDPHGGAPTYSGAVGVDAQGMKYFGHHLVIRPDAQQHLLSYYFTDTLQKFNQAKQKLDIATDRKQLWQKAPIQYASDEYLDKFMSVDPNSRGQYKHNQYFEAHVHRGTTHLDKRHIQKVVLDYRDPAFWLKNGVTLLSVISFRKRKAAVALILTAYSCLMWDSIFLELASEIFRFDSGRGLGARRGEALPTSRRGMLLEKDLLSASFDFVGFLVV